MSEQCEQYDVVIVGGGPAGATAGAVLGEYGRQVAVLEKSQFPRYRVGESLLPYCYFPLQRIGMIEALKRSNFVKKHSVQFVAQDGRASQPFYFFKHFEHEAAQTWQVMRSEFDQMLLENAAAKGAQVFEQTAAKALINDGDVTIGVEAESSDGVRRKLMAPMTIDCSGRDGFAIGRQGWRIRDPQLNKIAIWTYFKGAVRDSGYDEGATTIAYLPDKGWFWYIPLADDMASVGITAERAYLYRDGKDPEAIFERERQVNRWIAEHLAPAERVDGFRVTGDYSYRAKYCAGNGLLLAGDALAFLDPVFSSGVFLALNSGVLAGDAVEAALRAQDVSAGRFAEYGESMCSGIEAMRKLVYAFYDTAFSFGDVLRKHPHLSGDLTDCLIGHLERDFDPMFAAISEFATLPAPLPYGGAPGGLREAG